MRRACSTSRDKRNAYRILVGKPERKRPLRRPRYRWAVTIKMDFREIGWGGMCQTDMVVGALVNTVMNLWVP
jgi:hypothetical protein